MRKLVVGDKGKLISERAGKGRAAKSWLKGIAKQKEEGKAEESDGEPPLNRKLLWRCMKTRAAQPCLQNNGEYILIIVKVIKNPQQLYRLWGSHSLPFLCQHKLAKTVPAEDCEYIYISQLCK